MTGLGPILWALLVSAPSAEGLLVTADGILVLTDERWESRAPAWHPDGRRIAFESRRNGRWGIFQVDPGRGTVLPLVDAAANDRNPAWTPGGTRLVFVREQDGDSDLYLLDLEEDTVTRLLAGPGNEAYPDVSPDGEAVAFTVLGDNRPRLRMLGWFGKWMRDLGEGVWVRFSPRDSTMAFFSRRDTGGTDDEIYLADADGSGVTRITHRGGHDFCPAWSPDGQRLVLVSIEPDGSRALRIIDRQGRELRRLAGGYHRVTEPDWSPDGQFIAYAAIPAQGQAYRIYVESID